jgi:hypothetical protein
MSLVVVERSFEHSGTQLAELEALEAPLGDCMSARGVLPLGSYFSLDRRHLVCLYESPDAESVRELQGHGELPYDRIWAANELGEALLRDPAPWSAVMVQRSIPEEQRNGAYLERAQKALGCLHLYRVKHAISLISYDRSRAICFYSAPDAEALRIIGEKYDLPAERISKVSVHMPS